MDVTGFGSIGSSLSLAYSDALQYNISIKPGMLLIGLFLLWFCIP